MPRSRTALLIALLAGALVLSGCGSGDDGGGGAAPAAGGGYGGQPAPSTTAASADAGGSGELTAQDFAFSPAELSFPGGADISFVFKNADSAQHSFTLEGVDGIDEVVAGG